MTETRWFGAVHVPMNESSSWVHCERPVSGWLACHRGYMVQCTGPSGMRTAARLVNESAGKTSAVTASATG